MPDFASSAFWARFVLAVLAAWRISQLLAREDGPGALVARLRGVLGRIGAQGWLDCFGCVSFWAAAPAALWAAGFCPGWIVVWLAVAGGVLVVDRLGAEPVVLRALDQEADHGML